MRWTNDTKQLHGTSDPNKIVETLILCAEERKVAGPRYRLLSQKSDLPIISNVPPLIYEKEKLKKYITPLKSNRIIKFIAHLQSNIDIVQNSDSLEPSTLEKGESFQLNQCYNNSKRLFQLVKYLKKIKVIPKKHKVQIVLGHIVSEIPFGTNIGDIVVENDSLILHDWHIWNYINNVLIDLSLFQDGNLLSFNSKMPSWGDTKDHVFITPPNGIAYFGKAYTDLGRFDNKIQLCFEQPE
jgi:hypothetical protein